MHAHTKPAQFWSEVDATCQDLLSNVHLPLEIEAYLQRTAPHDDQPTSYNSQLRAALQSAEPLFHLGNDAWQPTNAFHALDAELEAVEHQLQSLVSSLEHSSAALLDSAHRRTQLKRSVNVLEDELGHIDHFVTAIVLPDRSRAAIKSANPHSDDFKAALVLLSQKLTFCHSHNNARAVQDVHPSLLSLRDVSIRRIADRLRESFRLMAHPSSSFTILRDTLLLKQRPLIEFLTSHERTLFESFTRQYVKVAKLAFSVYMRSFYCLLAPCGSNDDGAVNFSFVRHRTSKMLSSIWDYASPTSKPPDTRGELERRGFPRSLQNSNGRKEDINLLSNRCVDAMRNALGPPLTEAEIRLKGNTVSFPLDCMFRELAASFLSYEKSELLFLTEAFGDGGREFLSDIFTDKGNPALSCLEESIQSLDSTSEPEQLCLCLYVCRRIRESIDNRRGVDPRVTFFVLAERMIQTRFVPVLESRAQVAKELLLQNSSRGFFGNALAPGMTPFASFVSNLLVIGQQGDKWIHSQNVGYALRKRLHSCITAVLATADAVMQPDDTNDSGIKAYLQCATSLLFALDICASIGSHHHDTEDLRRIVQYSFCRGCKAYARTFEDLNLKEIGQLESSVSLQPLGESMEQCGVLLDKLNQTERMVTESMNFLADDDEDAYQGEAVQSVMNSLRLRTAALKQTLSRHHPELADMLDW